MGSNPTLSASGFFEGALRHGTVSLEVRVPNEVHERQGWLVPSRVPEVRLLDAWELPVSGSRDDFAAFLGLVERFDVARSAPFPTRELFALRALIGRLLGWDRLPKRLTIADVFVPICRTETEWAGEIRNATVHGVLQLCWVPLANRRWGGRLAVYVRPHGVLGRAYLAVIAPFRHLVVYPQLMKVIAREWRAAAPARHRGAVTG